MEAPGDDLNGTYWSTTSRKSRRNVNTTRSHDHYNAESKSQKSKRGGSASKNTNSQNVRNSTKCDFPSSEKMKDNQVSCKDIQDRCVRTSSKKGGKGMIKRIEDAQNTSTDNLTSIKPKISINSSESIESILSSRSKSGFITKKQSLAMSSSPRLDNSNNTESESPKSPKDVKRTGGNVNSHNAQDLRKCNLPSSEDVQCSQISSIDIQEVGVRTASSKEKKATIRRDGDVNASRTINAEILYLDNIKCYEGSLNNIETTSPPRPKSGSTKKKKSSRKSSPKCYSTENTPTPSKDLATATKKLHSILTPRLNFSPIMKTKKITSFNETIDYSQIMPRDSKKDKVQNSTRLKMDENSNTKSLITSYLSCTMKSRRRDSTNDKLRRQSFMKKRRYSRVRCHNPNKTAFGKKKKKLYPHTTNDVLTKSPEEEESKLRVRRNVNKMDSMVISKSFAIAEYNNNKFFSFKIPKHARIGDLKIAVNPNATRQTDKTRRKHVVKENFNRSNVKNGKTKSIKGKDSNKKIVSDKTILSHSSKAKIENTETRLKCDVLPSSNFNELPSSISSADLVSVDPSDAEKSCQVPNEIKPYELNSETELKIQSEGSENLVNNFSDKVETRIANDDNRKILAGTSGKSKANVDANSTSSKQFDPLKDRVENIDEKLKSNDVELSMRINDEKKLFLSKKPLRKKKYLHSNNTTNLFDEEIDYSETNESCQMNVTCHNTIMKSVIFSLK